MKKRHVSYPIEQRELKYFYVKMLVLVSFTKGRVWLMKLCSYIVMIMVTGGHIHQRFPLQTFSYYKITKFSLSKLWINDLSKFYATRISCYSYSSYFLANHIACIIMCYTPLKPYFKDIYSVISLISGRYWVITTC